MIAARMRVLRVKRRVSRLRARAVQYAAHGWPVVPLRRVEPREQRPVGLVPVEGIEPSTDPAVVAGWWAHLPYRVGLATGIVFDVIDAPPVLGSVAHERLLLSTATALAAEHRWLFVVTPGADLPESLAAAGVVRYGAAGWVAAPPSLPSGGAPYWLVEPRVPQWRPMNAAVVHAALMDAAVERTAGMRRSRS